MNPFNLSQARPALPLSPNIPGVWGQRPQSVGLRLAQFELKGEQT